MLSIICFVVAFLVAFALTFIELKKGVGKPGTFVFRDFKTKKLVRVLFLFFWVFLIASSLLENPLLDPLYDENLSGFALSALELGAEISIIACAVFVVWCLIYFLDWLCWQVKKLCRRNT